MPPAGQIYKPESCELQIFTHRPSDIGTLRLDTISWLKNSAKT